MNGNKIVFPIFMILSACTSPMTSEDKEAFRKADVNVDKKLTLQEAQAFELARVFDDLDTNQDDKISFAEAREIHPDFRWKQFQEYDKNGNSMVTRQEFFAVQITKGTIQARFVAADSNGDGVVTEKEAQKRAEFLMNEANGAR